MTALLDIQNLSKTFGGLKAVQDVSLTLPEGQLAAIIGPNGAGKTTLFKMITGQDKPDSGTFSVGPTVKLGYVDQSRETLDPNKTVLGNVEEGVAKTRALLKRFEELNEKHALIDRQGRHVVDHVAVGWLVQIGDGNR